MLGQRVLLVALLVLVSVEHSECVRCFARFNLIQGQCEGEVGEVDEDDCCQNPRYGYQAEDGLCHSCGPPTWSPWSPWSHCNVLCGEGVTQRRRKCFGIGQSQCEKPADFLETAPCTGTCCDAQGWDPWLPWSPCSVTCGEGGVRTRKRVCSVRPECRSACSGPSEEKEACPAQSTCPVHGGWTAWSVWSQCSGTCIYDQISSNNEGSRVVIPLRVQRRTCSNPAPSTDTVPPGNNCAGDDSQVQECSELPNCAVDGNWGAWSPAGPCSVSCGEGLQLSMRRCDRPAPKYGGRFCNGPSTRSSVCQSPCPVDGLWTGWSNWGECSSSCIRQGSVPTRTRQRTCSNPAPSSNPRGVSCQGEDRQTENCNHLPRCPVNGGWGAWSPYSACPVTCGVGAQVSVRRCENPPPQHGGQPCPGEKRRTTICHTNIHCPVDGVWSEWSPWQKCKYPFGSRDIHCKQLGGSQIRERQCLHRAHNGSICGGNDLTDRRVCYDVNRCPMKGTWDGWETWSLCKPSCGRPSKRIRRRHCKPDYSEYNPTIGRQREPATFSGTPLADCGAAPDNGLKFETQPCVNIPQCP
ncbi:properdin [Cheilinus undulatus]|uniref:properdin n=1 Tax=Cheilinus undulatus TaxID=241271 RepID=UPI001BD2FDD3|nr:properdin [Cheilinus undulatus]